MLSKFEYNGKKKWDFRKVAQILCQNGMSQNWVISTYAILELKLGSRHLSI